MGIARTFTFLGTGTSVGVPVIGCECSTCRSPNPKNQRLRCSVLITTPNGRILIDTPPDLRTQLLRAGIKLVHAVLFTHFHADHVFGLDDTRLFPKALGRPLPVYCTSQVESLLRNSFAYAFDPKMEHWPLGAIPKFSFNRIGTDPFSVLEQRVLPILLEHGTAPVLGFRFGDLAYCTDVSRIPETSWGRLQDLDVLVLDALRHDPHPTHFSIKQALEVVARLNPKQVYFTHMCHDLEHEATNARLPMGVELAYDGLEFDF